jgi:hypothetical protein
MEDLKEKIKHRRPDDSRNFYTKKFLYNEKK